MLKCHPITAFMKTHTHFKNTFDKVFGFKYIFPIKTKIPILDLMLLLKNSVPFAWYTTVVLHSRTYIKMVTTINYGWINNKRTTAIERTGAKNTECGWILNPYKPSVLFEGHWQTVQTQIRYHKTWRLISISTVCLKNVLF